MWELKQKLTAMDERHKELSPQRTEVAGGDIIWSNEQARQEYYSLRKKRKEINQKILDS